MAAKHHAGIHMHLSETPYQSVYAQRTYGKSAVAHLAELDFLGPELSCAHGVWLDDEDIERLAAARTTICHNPSSNLRLKNRGHRASTAHAQAAAARGGVRRGFERHQQTTRNYCRRCAWPRRCIGAWATMRRASAPADLLQMANENGARACRARRKNRHPGAWQARRRGAEINLDRLTDGLGENELEMSELLFQRGRDRHIDAVLVDGEVVFAAGKPTQLRQRGRRGRAARALRKNRGRRTKSSAGH